MDKRTQPKWSAPSVATNSKLKLYNSLTKEKEEFVPQNGNNVLWYSCGPTVYDAAHMGHARSYISFDILRRVLSDYFGYNVFYVMNITDIDDKIIKRARQNYLFEQYKSQNSNLENVIADIKEASKHFQTLLDAAEEKEKKDMLQKIIDRNSEAVKLAEYKLNSPDEMVDLSLLSEEERNTVLTRIVKDTKDSETETKVGYSVNDALQFLFTDSKDVLSEWLDLNKGHKVNDNSIFSELPARYEQEFFKDMDSLNVLKPDVLTRVSEYVPEIVQYIEKIIENGLAYESNSSVYFDTVKFDESPGHFYGKLVPEAFGDLKKLQEGEGDLSISSDRLKEKRNPSDFALWKASKPGEPSWESPWGKGRPGWHIECSVMASDVLGDSLDIHTGGYDLKFPHHDNELAQAEAYFNNDHWVRYFLHSGHLTIAGSKMSKSLKNFITIRDALDYHTARQIRLAFLLHSWKDTLDYSHQTLDNAMHYERVVREFILNLKDLMQKSLFGEKITFTKWGEDEKKLSNVFQKKKTGVHEALCDNIDTRSALENIHELIRYTNIYIQGKKKGQQRFDKRLLAQIQLYILKTLNMFGLNFGKSGKTQENEGGEFDTPKDKSNLEIELMKYIKVLSDFRDDIRKRGLEIKDRVILETCDAIRDSKLPPLGVRLEDQEGEKAAIKFMDPKELMEELLKQKKLDEIRKLEKEREKEKLKNQKAEKEALKKIPPSEMFRLMQDKYSQFDEKGLPTHDIEGKLLSESQAKKLKKLYDAQDKKHQSYLRSVAAS